MLIRGCTCPRSALPLARARSAPTKQVALFLGGAAVSAAPTKQTVHPQNKLIRGHGIPPCPLCFFPQGVSSHRAHLGGYGIPAIPTPPSEILPRNSRNSQKLLAEKSLPQMCIDAHRWLGCVGFSHGIHGIHRSFWRRRASHRWHRCSQMVRLRRVLPRNLRNTQKLLAENILQRNPRNTQKLLAEKSLP